MSKKKKTTNKKTNINHNKEIVEKTEILEIKENKQDNKIKEKQSDQFLKCCLKVSGRWLGG